MLIAQEEPTWFNNATEADAEAKRLFESSNCAVIEIPAGSFAVVTLNDLEEEKNVAEGTKDKATTLWGDDSLLIKYSGQVASWRLHLRTPRGGIRRSFGEAEDGDDYDRQGWRAWRNTHRK